VKTRWESLLAESHAPRSDGSRRMCERASEQRSSSSSSSTGRMGPGASSWAVTSFRPVSETLRWRRT
jgi:hypothetical protein